MPDYRKTDAERVFGFKKDHNVRVVPRRPSEVGRYALVAVSALLVAAPFIINSFFDRKNVDAVVYNAPVIERSYDQQDTPFRCFSREAAGLTNGYNTGMIDAYYDRFAKVNEENGITLDKYSKPVLGNRVLDLDLDRDGTPCR
jgi:hypothetical protein